MRAAGPERSGPLIQALELGLATERRVSFSARQDYVLRRIVACGSGRLGTHYRICEDCGHWEAVPKSCRDRHCPRCQKRQSQLWLETQQQALLPVPYYHLVFTLPHELNALIRQNPKVCLDLLFDAACSTVMDFGRNNLGASLGITALLHTWGQTLCEHYHLHMIITGGGLSHSEDEWIEASEGKRSERWLFSVRALSKVYQARYLEGLHRLQEAGELKFFGQISEMVETASFARHRRKWARRRWNVYAKAPFAGPEVVLQYLARYTHRIAISPGRVLNVDVDRNRVSFAYKNYNADGRWQAMELDTAEFTRRFAQHILPARFCKIRHYGLLSNRGRHQKVPLCRVLLGYEADWAPSEIHQDDLADLPSCGQSPESSGSREGHSCPCCGSPRLRWVSRPDCRDDGASSFNASRAPPPLIESSG